MCLGTKLVEISRKSSWNMLKSCGLKSKELLPPWLKSDDLQALSWQNETLQLDGNWLRYEHPWSCQGYPNPRPCRIHPGHTPQCLSLFKCAENLDSKNDDPGSKWSSRQMLILEERRRATEERLGLKVCTSKRRFRTREQGIWGCLRWFEHGISRGLDGYYSHVFHGFVHFCSTSNYQLPFLSSSLAACRELQADYPKPRTKLRGRSPRVWRPQVDIKRTSKCIYVYNII